MNEMQCKLLEMFKWFHNFCVENDFKYYALGGTALGAIRHKGFIPWDDDIDIGMYRKDYERLKKFVKNHSDKRFVFEFPGENKDFTYALAKLYDKTTTLVESTRYKIKRGLYIDIFPIDNIGDDEAEAISNFKIINRKFSLYLTTACALRKGRKLYKNIAVLLSRIIPGFIFDNRKLLNDIEMFCKKKKDDESCYVVNTYGAWREKEIGKREWFGNPVLHQFESMEIFCPEDYDAYLNALYGDYMQLPPIEKRVSHHEFLRIDLEKSYLE